MIGETWERLTGADFRIAYPDHLAAFTGRKRVLPQ